jgi:hypothetical protein
MGEDALKRSFVAIGQVKRHGDHGPFEAEQDKVHSMIFIAEWETTRIALDEDQNCPKTAGPRVGGHGGPQPATGGRTDHEVFAT